MFHLDLVLVNPANDRKVSATSESFFRSLPAIEPPMWTALLAAFVREKGFTVQVVDAAAENLTAQETAKKVMELNPVLIGIGVIGANPSASSTPKMPVASKLLHRLKDQQCAAKTFLYGIHPSALPEMTLSEEPVDFLFRGECFYTTIEVLDCLKTGRGVGCSQIPGLWYKNGEEIISGDWGICIENIDELPLIAWDLLPMGKYRAHNWHCGYHDNNRKPYGVIYTSFGCPFTCKFCNISALYNGKAGIRYRSAKKVVDEIEILVKDYGVKNIKIMDEMFALREDRVSEICDLVIERQFDLNIWAYSRIDTAGNLELLKKMKKAGINWLAFGIESGSKQVRNGMRKGKFDEERIKGTIKTVHDAGICVVGNFIFGLPGDDSQSMQNTFDLAKELNCEHANFYTAMAYPGSNLYEEAVRNGWPLPVTWDGYSQYSEQAMPLATENSTSAEILRFRDETFENYFSGDRYMDMIKGKFGEEAVSHIREMLKHKLKRRLLEKDCCHDHQ
ncbi:MAG: B12-binding domain-containing radical SAM protein [Omnitrophica bacterium RIFCSPLOWO2_12_FULL_44_17]|uniref:B12-binding domain-containing radical SAM protein n=1 Tax=Candidatus Danuiimicrobium aquiferis TaxID=1801832 RepID=A0A1G1KQ94_9BACT|nr:MAG: B12-binding domain-containing radical SAM protein [Omnitrophica bacterium RIFCSPHIGHO2_02_FULL_45_28]OGW92547.1 MAG: B12-binding domain-containing radical SAM protein [Omnitrophica bacterium RIFCSPHIGHO2_12_FULL_44_12]OGW95066.1 MAG: B12-binding domain-containing radical SAM protein [Omnitrophica bacterium RIFCSPLOWO2_12_FULL_44_17]OGX02986.1 MAG: B12-binding domain-containing radical SAM protein [Omnitrophica bacterium RIFCSPLOWO2_02_FULL_44_11]